MLIDNHISVILDTDYDYVCLTCFGFYISLLVFKCQLLAVFARIMSVGVNMFLGYIFCVCHLLYYLVNKKIDAMFLIVVMCVSRVEQFEGCSHYSLNKYD